VADGLESGDFVRALTEKDERADRRATPDPAGRPGGRVRAARLPSVPRSAGQRRLLKEIALDYEKIARTLVLVGLEVKLPSDLDKLAVRFRLSLPARTT
jgi:hypothetical protein